MIKRFVDFALNNRFIVLVGAVLLFGGARLLPQPPRRSLPRRRQQLRQQVITQWPGRSAEEVEQQVTVPLEIGWRASRT
jgi:cobalt-zinc-cadmium resistance protein CzcA